VAQKGAALRLRLGASKPSNVLRLKQRPYETNNNDKGCPPKIRGGLYQTNGRFKGAHRETCAKCATTMAATQATANSKAKGGRRKSKLQNQKIYSQRQTQPQKFIRSASR